MGVVFLFKAKNGKPDFVSEANRERFYQVMKKHEGREFRIEMLEEKRTLSQNNLYWLYLGIVEKETGNVADDLNEYFKRTLLPPRFIFVMGQEVKIPSSSTDLNKEQFAEYLDKIAAETGVPIPDTELFKKIHGMQDHRALDDEERRIISEAYKQTQQ